MELVERVARAVHTEIGKPGPDLPCRIAHAAITGALTIPADPSDEDRSTYQALCDELDRLGYRPSGWVEPVRLK